MGNIIVFLVIVMVLSLSLYKVVSDKKKGFKCSGCPSAPRGNVGNGKPSSCVCPHGDQ